MKMGYSVLMTQNAGDIGETALSIGCTYQHP